MNDAQTISLWRSCERIAEKLGMIIATDHSTNVSVQGSGKKDSFKSFYCCQTVEELHGYLNGVLDAKEKLTK